jgi:hypothetical protein
MDSVLKPAGICLLDSTDLVTDCSISPLYFVTRWEALALTLSLQPYLRTSTLMSRSVFMSLQRQLLDVPQNPVRFSVRWDLASSLNQLIAN